MEVSKKRVFVYGYFGRRNAGDDAMLYAFLSAAASVYPSLEFRVLRGEDLPEIPDNAKKSTTFVQSNFPAVFRSLLGAEAFAIVGGTHLSDYGLNRRTVKVIGRIGLLVGLAKLLGRKVYFLGVGLGPFHRFLSTAVARVICTYVHAINVRDQASYDVSVGLGTGERTTLGFDVTALVDWDMKTTSRTEPIAQRSLGISITPVFTIYHDDEKSDRSLVKAVGEAVNAWMTEHPDWRIDLFIFHGQSTSMQDDDAHITRQLAAILSPKDRVRIVDYDPTPARMLRNVSRCSAFLGMKYHSCIFAYLGDVPLLIIPYHPKCTVLAKEIGLPDEALLPLDKVLGGELGKHLELLTTARTVMRATLPHDVSKARAKTAIHVLTEVNGE